MYFCHEISTNQKKIKMKKLMAICAATLMLAGVATSCSKVCECTVSYEGYSETGEIDLSETNYKNCNSYAQAVENLYGGLYQVSCKRK